MIDDNAIYVPAIDFERSLNDCLICCGGLSRLPEASPLFVALPPAQALRLDVIMTRYVANVRREKSHEAVCGRPVALCHEHDASWRSGA